MGGPAADAGVHPTEGQRRLVRSIRPGKLRFADLAALQLPGESLAAGDRHGSFRFFSTDSPVECGVIGVDEFGIGIGLGGFGRFGCCCGGDRRGIGGDLLLVLSDPVWIRRLCVLRVGERGEERCAQEGKRGEDSSVCHFAIPSIC